MDGSSPGGADWRLTRSGFLKRSMAALAVGSAGPLLAACGGGRGSGSPASGAQAGGAATRGGVLRVGMVGAGTSETFDPIHGVTIIDAARIKNVFDPLTIVDRDLSLQPGLALEWNANKDATVWEIKLRPDVTFHDGKPLTADDVIYSIQRMGEKTSAAAPFVAGIRLGELKRLDKLTLRVPLAAADARLQENFVYYNTNIVQDGAKSFDKPVGTGAFVFESFSPGRESLIRGNPDYWQEGKPLVEAVKIEAISDDTARLNALLAGEIDAMAQLPFAQAKAHSATNDIQILDAPGPQPMMFYMAVDEPPFDDPRVRLAMKLIADRQALIDGALAGYGTVANDIVGKGLPFFNDDLPQRTQDIEQAKSLLKQAGRSDLRVTLNTSSLFPGFVESATLLAEQASQAGVTIDLKRVSPDAYYNPSLSYLKMAFAETQWPAPSLKYFYLQALSSTAPYNETHWRSERFDDLLQQAIGEPDEARATEHWHAVQKLQYDEGGYLNWAQYNWVDALGRNVRGLEPSAFGPLDNSNFQDAWLA